MQSGDSGGQAHAGGGGWPHHIWVALVVASLVHLLKDLHVPLELPAVVMAASVAQHYDPEDEPSKIDERQWLAVATIDERQFLEEYEGVRPLNRCRLVGALRRILENREIRILAIDLDLSPVRVDSQIACQTTLEQLLREHAQRLILIRPLEDRDEAWMSAMKRGAPSLTFVEPTFRANFGVVWKYADGNLLGSVLARRLCELRPEGQDTGLARCREEKTRKAGGHEAGRAHDAKNAEYISFRDQRYLHKGGEPIALDDPCLVGAVKDCKVRAVIVGGEYGAREDVFTTPVGRLPGVRVHAAIAAQSGRKIAHVYEFVLEVALGALVFGPLARTLWARYFDQSSGHRILPFWYWRFLLASAFVGAVVLAIFAPEAAPLWLPAAVFAILGILIAVRARSPAAVAADNPLLAYRWLVLFAVLTMAFLIGFLYGAVAFYAAWGVWLSPVPIAIGMTLEAAVTTGVHEASRLLKEKQAASASRHPAAHAMPTGDEDIQPLIDQVRAAATALVQRVAELRDAASGEEAARRVPPVVAASAEGSTEADAASAVALVPAQPPSVVLPGLAALASDAESLLDKTGTLASAVRRKRRVLAEPAEAVNPMTERGDWKGGPPLISGAVARRSLGKLLDACRHPVARLPTLIGVFLVVWALADVLGMFH